jgi:hypothetical protein
MLADEKPAWVRSDALSRLRRLARDPDWLVNALAHSQPRSDVLSLWLRDADLPKLDAYPLVRSGLSADRAAAELDVSRRNREPIEAYASRDVADQIIRRFAPEQGVDDPNVILRVPRVPWVLGKEEAPLAVSAADLLNHRDARVRRAAGDVLREHAHR